MKGLTWPDVVLRCGCDPKTVCRTQSRFDFVGIVLCQRSSRSVPTGHSIAKPAILTIQRTPLFNITLVKTGAVQTVIADNHLGLRYFPDTALTVIKGNGQNAFRALLAAGVSSWLIQGGSVMTVTNATQVFTKGGAGEFDNGYAGISGAYYQPDGRLYVIYHAEDQEGMPLIGGGIPGFYCSVGLAVSTNNGASFEKSGAIITSQKPKSWNAFPGQADKGAGEPCCVLSRDGGWLYGYYTDHSR